MYFLIQNGNQDLYYKLDEFAATYVNIKSDKIQSKVNFSTTMTWICIGVIFICFLAIVPLLGRIQTRILALMSIFFNINKEIKDKMIQQIHKFNAMIKPTVT